MQARVCVKIRMLVMTLASVLSRSTTKLMYMYACPYKEVGAVWGTKSVGEGGSSL